MRLGHWCGALALAGSVAGCLTPNPALTDSAGDTEGDGSSTGSATSGSPTGNPTATTNGPSSTTASTEATTVDPDTTVGPDTDDPSGDTETTGPAACGAGNVCAPEVPAGWAGPVVWAETATADPQPACPDAYAELAFNAFDDLQAPPAECSCDCGAAVGAGCADPTLEYHGTSSSCPGAADEEFVIDAGGNCNTGPSYGTGRYWQVEDPGLDGGECAPMETVEVPPAGFSQTSTVCGGAAPADGQCMEDQSCVAAPPDGFESRLCVWQEGDLECPSGDYADRFVRHADFTDARNCTSCTCGDPTGSCSGSVVLFGSGNCSGNPSLLVSIGGSCSNNAGGSVSSADVSTLTVEDASCTPAGGVPTGEAEPDEPYTLCCMSV